MKLLFFILSSYCPVYLFHPIEKTAPPGLILWESDRPLTWEDFNGTPDENSEYDASCYSSVYYKYSYNKNRNIKFQYDVHCYFNTSKSWVKRKRPPERLLLHEQLHFDIEELCSRRLRKRFMEAYYLDSFTREEIKDEVDLMYSSLSLECEGIQKRYDKETRHGTDKAVQKEWSAKVQASLKELEAFGHDKETCIFDGL